MDLEEVGINARNCVNSALDRDYWNPCECGIEPPGSISYGVSKLDIYSYYGAVYLLCTG